MSLFPYVEMKQAAKTLSDIFGVEIEARLRATYAGPSEDTVHLYLDGMLLLERKLHE